MKTKTQVANKTFEQTGDFEAVHAAEKWCADNGISVGTMQADAPRGLKRGDYNILKWSNLDKSDEQSLDGRMTGDMRNGPVCIELTEANSN
jgi:hypothetical protein